MKTDYTVWQDLSGSLNEMRTVWSQTDGPATEQLKLFVITLFSKIYSTLGWDPKPNESDLSAMLRPIVISQLESAGHEEVIKEAKHRFELFLQDPSKLPADLRFEVYKAVVRNGGSKEYEQVFHIVKTADMHEEKLRALRALGYTRDKETLLKTLDLSFSEHVKSQDIFYVTHSCGATAFGRDITWNYIKENWSQFDKALSGGFLLLGRIIQYATSSFAVEEKAKDIEQFFQLHPVPQAERTIKQSLESIRTNSKWLEGSKAVVANYLNQHYKK